MSVLMSALNVGMNAFSYSDFKKKGNSTAVAVGKTAFQLAAFELAAPLMMGLMAKDLLVGGVNAVNQVGRANAKQTSKSYKSSFGGTYQDTEKGATMRQRGLQAIQQNGLNARNVLGSEARSYFRNGY